MKLRTAISVIWLAATAVNVGWAQAVVHDKAGNTYTCRTPDGKIYSRTGAMHKYDIAEAIKAGEHNPSQHDPICIDAVNKHKITWLWKGEKNIAVTFGPMTNDSGMGGTGKQCWTSTQPFVGPPTGGTDALQSKEADTSLQWCAYKMQFSSSRKTYDPHIIITGNVSILLKALQERKTYLENVINDLEKEKK